MDQFHLKTGDTSPALRYSLLPSIVDLTGATVVFNMRGSEAVLLRESARVVSTSPPVVEFMGWTEEATRQAGYYRGEFEVTYADGSIETFPNRGYIPIVIDKDLG